MSNFNFPETVLRDASGNALVGALVYFYEVGTTTLKATYQDRGLTVPNTNPVVTNGYGATPPVFMVADAYKIVATTALGVSLPQYSHDDYSPNKPDITGTVAGSSASSTAAVTGTNSGSGAGVKAVNTGSGHALWVEGDTSDPAKAALHVVPQDNYPSAPVKGDFVCDTSSGVYSGYNGSRRTPFPAMIHVSLGTSTKNAAAPNGTQFDDPAVIAANTLVPGSILRVRAGVTLVTSVGTPELYVALFLGTTFLGANQIGIAQADNTSSAGQVITVDSEVVVESIGAGGSYRSVSFGVWGFYSGTRVRSHANGSTAINTTVANYIYASMMIVGGTSGSGRLDFFRVDAS